MNEVAKAGQRSVLSQWLKWRAKVWEIQSQIPIAMGASWVTLGRLWTLSLILMLKWRSVECREGQRSNEANKYLFFLIPSWGR